MLRRDRLPEGTVHSLFDKNIFLYYEEKVLGRNLKGLGLKTVLVTDASYVHAHSVSIDKSVGKIVGKQKLLHKSKLYYYKKYLHAGPVRMAFARAFLGVVGNTGASLVAPKAAAPERNQTNESRRENDPGYPFLHALV